MKYKTILLFGAPGAGKGTQGKILGTIPNFFHCACGDVFRSLKTDSDLGRVFLEYSSKGQLVPDEPTVQLWRHFIEASTKTGRFHPGQDTLVLVLTEYVVFVVVSDADDEVPVSVFE